MTVDDATRWESFLGGRLRLRQAVRGHRAGTDALLLAAATPSSTRGLILDVGADAGVVGLAAALRAPAARVGLVEVDAAACVRARANIAANDLAARVAVYEADVASPAARRAAGLAPETAALVLTNPPFHAPDQVRATPDPDKARAHVLRMPLESWLRACLALLAPGGMLVMVHRADALGACLAAVEGRLGALAVLPVLPRPGSPATRLLLRGVKGSRAPLSIRAPLVLHAPDGGFAPAAESLFRDPTAPDLFC
jgi:tRNA1(Val) A37 N6-methylase TrmN6